MRPRLLAWQWSLYAEAHRDRRNLVIHLLTMPVFLAGVLAVPAGLYLHRWITSALGVAAMALVVVVQGVGHKLEKNPPVPIAGFVDLVTRIFAEQLVTFPRFVATGALVRAWLANGRDPG